MEKYRKLKKKLRPVYGFDKQDIKSFSEDVLREERALREYAAHKSDARRLGVHLLVHLN